MIRPANHADIPGLVEMGAVMHAESRYSRMTYDPAKVAVVLGMILERGAVFVAERDGEIIGGFAGVVEEHWFSSDKVATDLALFVQPGKRGSLAAVQLLKAFLVWASEKGAVMTDILINTGVRTEQTAKLFSLCGGEQAGYVFSWGRP